MAPRYRKSFRLPGAGGRGHPAGSIPTENPPGVASTPVGGNPHQFKGPSKGFEAKAVEEGLYLMVDMPGVEDNGAEVWMEESELFFSGEAQKEAEFETNRMYGGCIDLGSDARDVSELKIDMKNGVLRIILVGCKIQPEVLDLGVPNSSSTPSPNSSTPPPDPSLREWFRAGNFTISIRSYSVFKPPEGSCGIYPFQLTGSLESCQTVILSTDQLFIRVDMPDVPNNKKTVKFRDDIVLFGGEGEKWSEHDDEGCRGFFGRQRLLCGCCRYVNIQSEIKYGVLRMLLEKKRIKGRKPLCNCNNHS